MARGGASYSAWYGMDAPWGHSVSGERTANELWEYKLAAEVPGGRRGCAKPNLSTWTWYPLRCCVIDSDVCWSVDSDAMPAEGLVCACL